MYRNIKGQLVKDNFLLQPLASLTLNSGWQAQLASPYPLCHLIGIPPLKLQPPCPPVLFSSLFLVLALIII